MKQAENTAHALADRMQAPDRAGAEIGERLDRHFNWIAVGPTALVMFAVFGVPLAFSLYLSLTGVVAPGQSLFGGRFVGLANYADLFADSEFLTSVVRTLVYTFVVVGIEMTLGLGIAMLLNADLPGIGFFRTALIIPMLMTPIVAALCWRLLLDPNGIINAMFGLRTVWLGEPRLAMISVSIVNIWQNVPYVALLLLAGLRSMPKEPAEAAAIDGASQFQIFRHVTVPLLENHILVALLIRTIFEFRSFENVYGMTGGGPANATQLLSVFTYMASFVRFDLSMGAAASWLMLLIAMAMCVAFMMILRRRRPL